MNVLIIYAHPEPKSLNGHLKNTTVNYLKSIRYSVTVSDLYKMKSVSFRWVMLDHCAL